MNERIKELAKQAEGTKKHVPAVWQFYDHELEKFAELIVRECMDAAGSDEHSPSYEARARIARHFGIEE